ncbi:MAG TPA: pantetheine-phosphate adenylyltransferase [Bacilli bacterium]|nr:pantetheine-phosphate adenylyltransferase [Bacilli bacterium]
MKKAVFPGTFDPITNGHLSIINRAAKLFDTLYILVSLNPNKKPYFNANERVEMIKNVTKHLGNVIIDTYDDLVVKYARDNHINVIIRGVRNSADYENELSLYHFNSEIDNTIETVVLMPSSDNIFISSSAIRELASFGGDISKYVPTEIIPTVLTKFKK